MPRFHLFHYPRYWIEVDDHPLHQRDLTCMKCGKLLSSINDDFYPGPSGYGIES